MQCTRQRGAAIIEFALILPLLLLLTFITTEFGRAMYEYNHLTKLARDGARYLSGVTESQAAQMPAEVNRARNIVVYGDPDGGSVRRLPQLGTDRIEAAWSTSGTAPVINVVTVTIRGYPFQPMVANVFGLPFGIVFPDITATLRSPLV